MKLNLVPVLSNKTYECYYTVAGETFTVRIDGKEAVYDLSSAETGIRKEVVYDNDLPVDPGLKFHRDKDGEIVVQASKFIIEPKYNKPEEPTMDAMDLPLAPKPHFVEQRPTEPLTEESSEEVKTQWADYNAKLDAHKKSLEAWDLEKAEYDKEYARVSKLDEASREQYLAQKVIADKEYSEALEVFKKENQATVITL